MARPERNSVDYFPFYCKEGKAMFYIENKYGNDGYAVWLKLLRLLAVTDYHYLNLHSKPDLMFTSSKCRVSEEILISIIDDLCELGEFNKMLWEENRIIWSDKFMNSIQDAYSKRNNNPLSFEGLLDLLNGLGVRKLSKSKTKDPVKPQSIVEYSKEEDTKEKKSKKNILMSEANASDVSEKNKPYFDCGISFYQLFVRNSTEILNVEWKHLKSVKAEIFLNEIRLMIEADNRTMDDLRKVWEFLKTDDFWMQNIQSSKKLREKFDQLITKAKNNNTNGKGKSFTQQANEFLRANDPDYKNY